MLTADNHLCCRNTSSEKIDSIASHGKPDTEGEKKSLLRNVVHCTVLILKEFLGFGAGFFFALNVEENYRIKEIYERNHHNH